MFDRTRIRAAQRIGLAWLLCAAAAACFAQDASGKYPVKGVALDSVTHQPIARVLVDAHADAVLTDNDGHFELALPGGAANLDVHRPGYDRDDRNSSHAVTVAANMSDLTFYLTPDPILSGHVTLSTGDDPDGIRIRAYCRRTVNGRERWVMVGSATTNSEGAFRLANLPPSSSCLVYSMPARDRAGPIAPGAMSYGYPSVYFPGVMDLAAAGILHLAPGQQATADFTLARQPFYSVTITATNRTEGRGGIPLQIHDESGRPLEGGGARWLPEQSAAQINLPNGHYYAEARYGGQPQMYGRVDFTVAGAPISGLMMTVLPVHSIPVEIHKDFTASSSAGVEATSLEQPQRDDDPGLSMNLTSAEAFDAGGFFGGMQRQQGSSGSAQYELSDVWPGTYWVNTHVFQGYVSSITSGGVDLMREPLVVGPGSTSQPIMVTLRNDAGSISGQLNQQASSAAGSAATLRAHIYAIPSFATTSNVPEVMAQSSGQFSIYNLAPGSYHVIALDQAADISPDDTQELSKYTGKGETVTVEANGTANVQLSIISVDGGEPAP